MKTSPFAIAAVIAVLSASCDKKAPDAAEAKAAANPNEVVLAGKHFLPAAGTIATKEMTMMMTGATLKIEAGGQTMNGTADQSTKGKETMEVISKDKVRKTVVSKKTEGKMTINGQDQPTPPQPDPLEGTPVILERSGDKWTAKLESNATADTSQQAALEKMAGEMTKDSDFEMYGDKPRKPGDKWTSDPAKMTMFGDSGNVSGTCSTEFVEIADYQGTRCAVLKSNLDIKGKTGEKGQGEAMNLSFKAEAICHRSIADQVDMAVDVKGTMTVDGAPAPNVTMVMSGPMTMKETTTVKKP